jgi:tetratricopeptide (TPR) repeat protein
VDERGEGAFTVHRLVQVVMRDRLAEAARVSEIMALALELVTYAFPRKSAEFSNWPVCKVLTPHALAILHAVPDTAEAASRVSLLAFNIARYLQPAARYSEAEPLLKRVLEIYDKTAGGEDPFTSATLRELARLYRAQGRYSEAEPLLKRSLTINEKTVGDEHPETSVTLYELALLYRAQGRYNEAEPLARRSLAIDERTLDGEHPASTLAVSTRQKRRSPVQEPFNCAPGSRAPRSCWDD